MSHRARYMTLFAFTAVAFVTLGKAPRLVTLGARDLRAAVISETASER